MDGVFLWEDKVFWRFVVNITSWELSRDEISNTVDLNLDCLPSGVEVACALMYVTLSAAIPASLNAALIQSSAPSPSSHGAVM